MYLILDKVHRIVQIGLSRENLSVATCGAQMTTRAAFAHEDERTFSCCLPLALDNLTLRPIHYRFAFSKDWSFRWLHRVLVEAVKTYRIFRPFVLRVFDFIDRYRVVISLLLIAGIVTHAFLLNTKIKERPVARPVAKFNLKETIAYWQNTKLAKRMDLERHAFVADDAFYYGSSKGFLAIPVTAQRSPQYAGKHFIVLARVQHAFAIANESRVEAVKKTDCKTGIIAYLFEGKAKVVIFPDALPTKLLRRFVLTEAIENPQPTVNLCEDYAALIEHFAEL